jgi:hypothetical protein
MAPLDSPELVRVVPRPPASSAPALLAWTVPVVSLDAAWALTALSERAESFRYGASLDYLGELAAFAWELAARGRVLPTVGRTGGGAVARWRPVVQGRDAVAVHELVTAMPPVCRAVPGRDDPHELVTVALYALVDAAAREMLPDGIDLMPVRRGRRPKRVPAVEGWLAALSAPDGRFDADPVDLDALTQALQPWDEVGTAQTGPVRHLPADGDQSPDSLPGTGDLHGGWTSCWSTDDPSLLLPARGLGDDGSLGRWLARPAGCCWQAGTGQPDLPRWPPVCGRRAVRSIWPPTGPTTSCRSRRRPWTRRVRVLLPSWWDRRLARARAVGVRGRRCGGQQAGSANTS